MSIKDEIIRIAIIKDKTYKLRELRNALWLFERNPLLSVDDVARGLALLVEAYLHEDDGQVKLTCLQTLSEILKSRPHAVGKQIDWEALTQQLAYVSQQEACCILAMMGHANDEKYLAVLEAYFDDLNLRFLAARSWIAVVYHETYQGDRRVWPYLERAYWAVTGRNVPPPPQQGKRYVGDNRQKLVREVEKLFERRPIHADEMRQILAETRLQVQREVLAHPVEEQYREEQREADPTTFVNRVRGWLAVADKESKQWEIEGLDWIFEEDMSAFIDDVAQVVKLLVDDVLQEEEAPIRWSIWSVVSKAFRHRIYVGAYLDWQSLTERLLQLAVNELGLVLFCYGYAPDEAYFAVLEGYLEHADSSIRSIAAQAMCHLIYHVSRYSPAVGEYFQETSRAIAGMKDAPESAEYRESIRSMLYGFQREARPHYQYYTV